MITDAASSGHYESPYHGGFPRIQILTIEDLLHGTKRPQWPDLSLCQQNFKQAKVEKKGRTQKGLFGHQR